MTNPHTPTGSTAPRARRIRPHVAGATTPPPGSRPARSTLASAAEVDAAVATADRGGAGVARGLAVAARGGAVRLPGAAARRAPTSWPRSSPPSTARCSPTPRARWPAGWRTSSSPPASRTCSRAASPSRPSTGVDVYSIRQPLGVVAGITPFNFPAMVPLWMCTNAIACGNAFVLKPSEKDPSASLFLAELWQEAGLPDGVFTVRPRRQGGGRRDPRPSGHRGGQLRRVDPDRPLHLRDAAPATASGCRRSAARRTTWSCCPTPTSTWPPTPPSRPPTARPASGAWPSRWWSRSATSADPLVDAIARPPAQAHGRRRQPTRTPRWAR